MIMKRMIAAILLLVLAVSLCACGQEAKPTQGSTVATTAPVPNTTVPPTTTVSDDKVTYKVTVTDENGNPIAGAMIQMCKDACVPGVTDAQGVVEYKLAEDTYKVSFLAVPTGYSYANETTEFYFESGSTELTIQLKKN